jgi:hypothetical protein
VSQISGDVWAEIRRAWPERDFRKLREVVETRFPANKLQRTPHAYVDALLDPDGGPGMRDASTDLADAFALAQSSDDRALVALYVYARCLDAWERSTDYMRIRRLLDALAATTRRPGDELLGILADQAQAMVCAIAAESAMCCSCPFETKTQAASVETKMTKVILGLERLDHESEVARAALSDAKAQQLYFDTVSRVAAAVERLIHPGSDGRVTFEQAIGATERAEKDMSLGVYKSELRAQKAALVSLREAESEPRLHIDRAEVV